MTVQYSLSHFDVIIYDALESPVLWVDGTEDNSIAGRKRAIPARHVRAVFEVKATLTPKHAKDAINKLSTLKTANAELYVLAALYARKMNVDDAILINHNGNVIEATGSSLFAVKVKKR